MQVGKTNPLRVSASSVARPDRKRRSTRAYRLCSEILARAVFCTLILTQSQAYADGGKVRFSQIVEPFQVTVFTNPTPLQTGPVDISVLVQQADSGEVIHDAVIDITLLCKDTQQTIHQRATNDSSNKLLQSSTVVLPTARNWQVSVQIEKTSSVYVEFELTVQESSVNVLSVVICLALPFVGAALFLLRDNLATRPPR